MQKKLEVGDVVNKIRRTNNLRRKGIVVRIPDEHQTVVLWENTKTAIYEFTSDLVFVKKSEDYKNCKDLYCVLVFGGIAVPIFHETYEEAEKEAKNLFFKTNQKTFVFKAISVIEQQDIKVKKLN